MDERRMRRWLWLALLLLLPLPNFGVQMALIPVLRHWLLVGVTVLFLLLESTGGVGPLLLVMLVVQAAIATAVTWGLSWTIVRTARLVPAAQRGRALVGLVALLAVVATAMPVYRTPYSSVAVHSTLWQVYR